MHPENWGNVVSDRAFLFKWISDKIGLPVPRWMSEQEQDRERQLIITFHNERQVAAWYLKNIEKGVK